jgi:hypothetical protein
MTFLNYITSKINEIKKYKQHGFSWKKYRENKFLRNISEFDKVIKDKSIPLLIDRSFIIDLYKNKRYYEAFVLSMVWGGINMTRPSEKGDLSSTNFHKALEIGRVKIETALRKSENYLLDGNIIGAYEIFKNENKIPGVGSSYFTKILFFQGLALKIETKPLIYDKWTKFIHIALMIAENDHKSLLNYYTPKSLETNIINSLSLIPVRSNKEESAYIDYVKRMNRVAKERDINVNSLEGYLFGNPLKGAKNKIRDNNPRVAMIEILRKDLNSILRTL